MMQLSDDMGAYKTSTMLDLTQRKPMEAHYLFRRPVSITCSHSSDEVIFSFLPARPVAINEQVQRAEKLGIPVPHLETLVIQIEAMQRMYNLF